MSLADSSPQTIMLIGPMPPPITGQSVAFSLLVEEFQRVGSVTVVNLSERRGRRDRQFSLMRALRILRLAAATWWRLRDVSLVYLTIAQSRAGFLRDLLFIVLARLRGRPVVAHLHGGNYSGFYRSENRAFRSLIRWTLRRTAWVIVLSQSLRQDFDFLGPDFAPRLRAVPNACPIPLGRQRGAPRGKLRLLFLSNLLVEKGYLDCVEAMGHLRRLLPGVPIRLVLAGAFMLGRDDYDTVADMEAALRESIRRLELDEVVTIAGVVDGAEKQRLLDCSHIHLLPTYYENEGQPIALIEALASGIPSIATAWRGIVDIVEDEATGLIVPAKDPMAIAEAAARLYRDPALYERLSAGAIVAAHGFARERHVAAMAGVFDEACRRRSPSPP